MTVSQSNIWKSALEVVRSPLGHRDKHLHIGGTLRDLYTAGSMPKTDGTFARLLDDLDAAEKDKRTNRA